MSPDGRVLVLVLVCLLCGVARVAHAQSCHVPGGASQVEGVTVGIAVREATVDHGGLESDYQGVRLGVGYALPPLELNAQLFGYRIERGSGPQLGLGDLMLDARASLLSGARDPSHPRDRMQSGIALAATLPTGRSSLGLGMGHVMLMPGFFVRASDDRAAMFARLGYGKALADTGSAHHHGHAAGHAGSLVEPMSSSELEGTIVLSVRVGEQYGALASLDAGVPIAEPSGSLRGVVGVGASAQLASLALSLLLELPVIGEPFSQRLTLAAALAL